MVPQMPVHRAKYFAIGLIYANFQTYSFKTEITRDRTKIAQFFVKILGAGHLQMMILSRNGCFLIKNLVITKLIVKNNDEYVNNSVIYST